MDPFPGSIGGHVGGSLVIKNIRDFNTKYQIELQCVHHYFSGKSKQRSHRERIKWAESGYGKNEMTGEGVRLKFRFDVPEGLPESDIDQKGNYYLWRIKVSANNSSNAVDRKYVIPVFNTQKQSAKIRHDISSQVVKMKP